MTRVQVPPAAKTKNNNSFFILVYEMTNWFYLLHWLSTRFKFKYGHNICHILKSIKDEEYSKLEKKCLKMSFFLNRELLF